MKNNIIILAFVTFLFSTQINAAVWNSKSDFQSKVCRVTNGNEAVNYCKIDLLTFDFISSRRCVDTACMLHLNII